MGWHAFLSPLLLRLLTVPPRLSGRSSPWSDVRAPSLELGEDFIAEQAEQADCEKKDDECSAI